MPGLLSSPVCLTVIWFLSVFPHPGVAEIQTSEVSGVQYGRLQSNVTLACGDSHSSLPVVWQLNNSAVVPWHKLTPDGRLVLFQANHSAQGNYSCYDNNGFLLHSVNLRLGYPPGLLNISCRLTNHSHVRCHWRELVKTYLPASYSAFFVGKGKTNWQPFTIDASRKHCDGEVDFFYEIMHYVNITETNPLGSRSTYFQMKMFELLKPDPPESIVVEKVEGFPQRLKVSWSYPSSWPSHYSFLALHFQLRYRPQGSKYWSQKQSKEKYAVIYDALAGHLMEVAVQAMDFSITESQWSEWSPTFTGRPWEAPTTTSAPDISTSENTPCTSLPDIAGSKSSDSIEEDEGNVGMVILLVLFSLFILIIVFSLVFVLRIRRRADASKQEVTSMVKMKAVPI